MAQFTGRKIVVAGLLTATLAITGAGCSAGTDTTASSSSAAQQAAEQAAFSATDQGMYVSCEWLQEHLGEVVVVDARSTSTFTMQHIPGAVGLHWSEVSNSEVGQGQPGWAELLPSDEIAAAAAQRGIDGTKPVVIYTDTRDGWGEDGRIYWTLREAGLEDVHILDGGWTRWLTQGGDVTASLHGNDIDPIAQVDTAYVKESMGTATLVDARMPEEFAGETTMGEVRAGHIPGAVNLAAVSLINADDALVSDDEVQALIDEAGLEATDEVIVYCTGGVRAAFVAEILADRGFENVSVYTAGFSEWTGDETNPIE